MRETADCVVIGAGVIGASVAYHLASRGQRVWVIDRGERPGSGSTSRATGGFRTFFPTEVNVRLALLSREMLLRFADELGTDPGFRSCGYVFVAERAKDLERLRAVCGVPGVEAIELSATEIGRHNPAVRLDTVAGGMFSSRDGFLDPISVMNGYLEGARPGGARLMFGEELAGFTLAKGRVAAVRTSKRSIACEAVVNAAGAWAAAASRMAGVDLPVVPLKRQVACTEQTSLLPEEMPMTVFVRDGFHLRVRDKRVLLLRPDDPKAGDPFDTSFDERWLEAILPRAIGCLPRLAGIAIERSACWAGLYEMSPDGHALLGAAPGVENLYLANGSSGHGVMHAPALGQLLAEQILDGETKSADVRALRPCRFAEGEPNATSALL